MNEEGVQIQEKFESLEKHPNFPEDPDFRCDDYRFIIERHSYGADNSFGWRVEENGKVVGNMVGKMPLMD